ncbi:MAG: Na(+)-translocating NADH-quinone reductase subunit C [Desulforhopalus sp.]
MADENPAKPFYSVLVLAFVCSALVAGAAVGLRPQQQANKAIDRKKHILYAANLFEKGKSIDELFTPIETKTVDLATGRYVNPQNIDPKASEQLSDADDIAKLNTVEKYKQVYLVKSGDKIDQIVLPVRGKGLWSTMYAFVALDGDLNTIRGVSFYEHGETPGLGGEIENKRWQAGWQGKKVYDDQGNEDLQFVKGGVDSGQPEASHQIDGLSGATLTTKGVENLMEFWFGNHGFKPYITQLKNKEKSHG